MKVPHKPPSVYEFVKLIGRRLPPAAGARGLPAPLVLHHCGIDDLALIEVQVLMKRLAAELALDLRLDPCEGDVVLADEYLARSLRPQLMAAFSQQRPIVILSREPATGGAVRGVIDYRALRAQVLALPNGWQPPAPALRQPGVLPLAADNAEPRRARQLDFSDSGSGFDSAFDSRLPGMALANLPLDKARTQFLQALHAGRSDPARGPVEASYAGGGLMVIDFARSLVKLERRALGELRLANQLPVLSPGALPEAELQTRELDCVLWDLGFAAGAHALNGAGANWWRQPLVALQPLQVARYSAAPLYRDLARAFDDGPQTPSQLRRRCRADISALRGFLQSFLLMGLLTWLPGEAGTTRPAASSVPRV